MEILLSLTYICIYDAFMMQKMHCHHQATSQTKSGQLSVSNWQLVSREVTTRTGDRDQFHPHANHRETNNNHETHLLILDTVKEYLELKLVKKTWMLQACDLHQTCIVMMNFQNIECWNMACPSSSWTLTPNQITCIHRYLQYIPNMKLWQNVTITVLVRIWCKSLYLQRSFHSMPCQAACKSTQLENNHFFLPRNICKHTFHIILGLIQAPYCRIGPFCREQKKQSPRSLAISIFNFNALEVEGPTFDFRQNLCASKNVFTIKNNLSQHYRPTERQRSVQSKHLSWSFHSKLTYPIDYTLKSSEHQWILRCFSSDIVWSFLAQLP